MLGASSTPAQVRAYVREHPVRSTAGLARGFMQANLLAVPQRHAFDFLLFAQRNPKPCPIVGVLEAGQYSSPLLPGGDIRTDVPGYRVFAEGQLVAEPADALAHWREDLVGFLIGCSFTFETALADNGIALAHIEQGRNVPMYRTNIATERAGIFGGPMVVSMRPIPAAQVADAVRVTSRYPQVHGAPVHVGNPEEIGIGDVSQPDFGEAVDIPAGHIPVFWACGVTPQAVVMDSCPELAITHQPGKMLVTDARDVDYQVP
ncbi:putative hydro-lyase [Corynebacterium lizhenjunii]|uniref:Putative hydro-lyase G7Y31_09105 n=1 Tax=Corynebacterium lizhenjunii TaxID=2709394 RepID=A0A7T0KDC4_9CORY|nr:putative hydro-lyase [Corynebacterium lizhenjunii]QPK78696.1 putative hydro-lyase [Corynebacterium lizhenjunii]